MVRMTLCACAISFCVPVLAQSGAPVTIVEPTFDARPVYSKEREPSAQQLIETWRSANLRLPQKRVDEERFEIIDRRIVWGKFGRAFLQFRIFSSGRDALAWAGGRCRGRKTLVELQVYYQFSPDLNAWVPQATKGDSSETLCSNQRLWTSDQIASMVSLKPLPAPPAISRADVAVAQIGSPKRMAILDALRPRYEALFGKPVAFKTVQLQVAAGFAFVLVHPQRPNGTPIEKRAWDHAFPGACFQNRQGIANEY
jgi:hypothetical protein